VLLVLDSLLLQDVRGLPCARLRVTASMERSRTEIASVGGTPGSVQVHLDDSAGTSRPEAKLAEPHQSAACEEEARDFANAVHLSSVEKEDADLQIALHLDRQMSFQRQLLDQKSTRLKNTTEETTVQVLRLTRCARTKDVAILLNVSPLLSTSLRCFLSSRYDRSE